MRNLQYCEGSSKFAVTVTISVIIIRLNHECGGQGVHSALLPHQHLCMTPSPILQTSAKRTLGQSVENLVTTTFCGKLTPMTGSPVKCIDFDRYRHLYD